VAKFVCSKKRLIKKNEDLGFLPYFHKPQVVLLLTFATFFFSCGLDFFYIPFLIVNLF